MTPKPTPREIARPEPADAEERRHAWDIHRSWIVEAPAGSGKTELLMQRFLCLLAYVEQPEQVLAITFTRKAVTEMRERIVEALRQAAASDATPETDRSDPGETYQTQTQRFAQQALETDRRLGWNLIQQPQRLNIRTIDSLCGEIAARVPLVSRLGAKMHPVEDATDLYQEAAQAALKELSGDSPRLAAAARTLLLHLDNRMEKAIDLIANMLRTRDQWGRVLPIERERTDEELDHLVREQFEASLRLHVERHLETCTQALRRETWEAIFRLGRCAAEQLESSGPTNPLRDLLSLGAVPGYETGHLTAWQTASRLLVTKTGSLRKPGGIDKRLGFPPRHPATQEMKALLASLEEAEEIAESMKRLGALPPPEYSATQCEVLRACFLLLRQAVAHLKVNFGRTGQVDFIELSLAALHALESDATNLSLAFGTEIRHLLIDEMQDTSITQFDMFRRLVQSWDGVSQTVFLVGDPKQSIYRFRQAEVGLFARAQREGLGDVRLHPIRLTSNFRSRQSLVEQANDIFFSIFGASQDADGVLFRASEAAHREDRRQRIFWHPATRPTRKKRETPGMPAEDPRIAEAERLCDRIEQLRAMGADGPPQRIAVLVRARAHATAILQAMRERGIPYRAVELDRLSDRPALLDLSAITRCLLHSADRIAWLAALRAPWCGLSLADLQVLTGNDDPTQHRKTVPELFRERGALLSADGRMRAGFTLDVLQAAREQSGQERLSMLVERTWRTLGGNLCVPAEDLPGVQQFLTMLDDLESDAGPVTAARLEARMHTLHAAAGATEESPVEVLTLYAAKGLEWDVVLLPGLHRTPRRDEERLVHWVELATDEELFPDEETEFSRSFLLAPIQSAEEEREPISMWIRAQESARTLTELRRLLYVGITRARSEVHLFGLCEVKDAGELSQPKQGSLLHTAWPAAESVFREAASVSAGARVLTMPTQEPEAGRLDLAAAAEPDPVIRLSNFRRLSSATIQARMAGKQTAYPVRDDSGDAGFFSPTAGDSREEPLFRRPQGSARARLFGTVLHAMLEPLAHLLQRAEGAEIAPVAMERLERAAHLQFLRGGETPPEATANTRRVLDALRRVARDPDGSWLLKSHPLPAATGLPASQHGFEVGLTALHRGEIRQVRMDRMFLAGESPHAAGADFLWIVDFKTAAHGPKGLEEFLAGEQQLYAAQLQVYAEIAGGLFPEQPQFRLGLYYPLLPRLIWWR